MLELRHLRCFVALAEELHFTRAAERLHIEQSPLSRTIKELEDELGALLFDRDRRGTRLTQAGAAFLEDVRRVFASLDQARENVKAISAGCRGSLHIAFSDCAVSPKLSGFLARWREDVPEVEIRVSETTLAEQRHGLRSGIFHLGFAHSDKGGAGIIAEPIWQEPLILAVPARHPLLTYKEVPIDELARYPLLMCDPRVCEGVGREVHRLLRKTEGEFNIAEHVSSSDMMFTLVAAGYGVGFTTAARVAASNHPDVVPRPLAVDDAILTTYLLRPESEILPIYLQEFLARIHALADENTHEAGDLSD